MIFVNAPLIHMPCRTYELSRMYGATSSYLRRGINEQVVTFEETSPNYWRNTCPDHHRTNHPILRCDDVPDGEWTSTQHKVGGLLERVVRWRDTNPNMRVL